MTTPAESAACKARETSKTESAAAGSVFFCARHHPASRPAGVSATQLELFAGSISSNVTDPGERWMHQLLSQPIPALDYRGETTLGEILDFLAEHYTQTHGAQGRSEGEEFRLTIWPEEFTLEDENIDSLDDVIVSVIRLEGIPLRQALDLIFDRTTDPPLTWDIRHGVFDVTTQDALEMEAKYRVTRIYPVGHSSICGLEDLIQEHLRTQNIELLQSGEEPAGPSLQYGIISTIGDSLIVTHHRQAQEAVARFLSLSFMIQVHPGLSALTRQRMAAETPVLKSWLVSHLAEKSLDDVRGGRAQEQIASEIREHFNGVLFPEGNGQIREVLFQQFAVQ